MLGLDCVGNENTTRREPCKRSRMRSRKPCRIGGKIHILEAHADHEMMSLTHVGLRKNAKPGPEQTRPPKYWNLNKKTKTTVPNDGAKPQHPMPGWSIKKLEKKPPNTVQGNKTILNQLVPRGVKRTKSRPLSPFIIGKRTITCQENEITPPRPPNPPNPPLKALKQLVRFPFRTRNLRQTKVMEPTSIGFWEVYKA